MHGSNNRLRKVDEREKKKVHMSMRKKMKTTEMLVIRSSSKDHRGQLG